MKWFLLILGWVFFSIGLLGVFLPLLPTTPFMLLAAWCFSKSSPQFYQWLIELPYIGQSVKDWHDHKVIRLKAKVMATVLITGALIYVGFFSVVANEIKLMMLLICLGVLLYIWLQKTHKNN